ncbi:MAG: hypothetical protein JWN98_652 [Abditibacteriota bacterium]|nr:hypothetical protein [Abditibacteriota bacterium]
MSELRFRQIHLDFHTSEKIHGVGDKFNKRQFQEMLKRGHVDSITLFSKCHHGMTYHDTKVGVRHPGMRDELLPRQLEACREIDVKTPIYISAGLDEAMAALHPEWCIQQKDGKLFDPLRAGWKTLSFASPYLDYLCAQIEEVIDLYDGGDGIFLDIIAARRDYSIWSLAAMREAGIDPTDDEQVDRMAEATLTKYFERTTAACRKKNPELRVFHNSGHIAKGNYAAMKWNSHLELESLPTGGWGYDHFPLSAKYAATTGYDILGMTGKFHTTWGEFGGFKRPNALRYECNAMLAFGSKCSIGDQLHPNGEMNEDTYNLIGEAYAEVKAKQDWASGARPVSEIALVSPEAMHTERFGGYRHKGQSEEGASRMLLELHEQFDVIDLEADLSQYRLVILPDEITLEAGSAFAQKLQVFLDGGGKVLLSGESGLSTDQSTFVLDCGVELVGNSQWNPDYIIAGPELATAPVRGAFVIHGGARDVRPKAGTQVLAQRAKPYFNRAWDHFCSHQHTPDAEIMEFPAVTSNGQIAYFAHSIFKSYRELGQPLYRDLVQDVLQHLLGARSVQTNLPTAARVSLMQQQKDNRYIMHLLFAVPVKRGSDQARWGSGSTTVEVIEDLYPLRDVQCAVRLPQNIASARLVPGNQELPLQNEGDAISFVVPELLCHQMIELSYKD